MGLAYDFTAGEKEICMKRSILFVALLLCVMLAALSCSVDKRPTAIALKDHGEDITVEVPVGGFDMSDYTVVVSYDNGETEEIALDESMISASDRAKLFQAGSHTILINYKKLTTELKVSVKRNEFGEISFPENTVFVYDGGEHTVELIGEIPAHAKITYPSGNSFVNAGTYDVSAIISCDGYVTKRVSSKVTVERATYDMSDAKLESKDVVYNGQPHMITVSGNLPEGVPEPIYYVNDNLATSVTEAGTYSVKAVFNNLDSNYDPIPPMEATLTVKKAAHVLGDLYLSVFGEDNTPINSGYKIYDGEEIRIALGIGSTLPNGTSVYYKVAKNGGEPSEALDEILLKDIGLYTVTAYFKLSDSKNYEGIDPIEISFEIERAAYPIGEVHLDPDITVFDGREQSIRVDGTIPEGVSVRYEYYLNDVLQKDADGEPLQEVVNVGKYTVKALFAHSESNYLEIPELSAQFEILPFAPDVSKISFEQMEYGTYDGEFKSLTVSGELPEGLTVRYEYYLDGVLQTGADGAPLQSVSDAGNYTVYAIFVPVNGNYTAPQPKTASFYIGAKEIDMSSVGLEQNSFVYDGAAKLPELTALPDGVIKDGVDKLYSVIGGVETKVTEAVNVGIYKLKFTFTPKNGNYALSVSGEVAFDFEITPQLFDASGISVAEETPTVHKYDGNSVAVTVNGSYSDFAEVKYLFVKSGEYVEEIKEIGVYKIVLMLKPEYSGGNYAITDGEGSYDPFVIHSITVYEIDELGSLEWVSPLRYGGRDRLYRRGIS